MVASGYPPVMDHIEFRAWRKRMGLTQSAAASALQAHVQTVKRWESGDRPVSDTVAAFALELERGGRRKGGVAQAAEAIAPPPAPDPTGTDEADRQLWQAALRRAVAVSQLVDSAEAGDLKAQQAAYARVTEATAAVDAAVQAGGHSEAMSRQAGVFLALSKNVMRAMEMLYSERRAHIADREAHAKELQQLSGIVHAIHLDARNMILGETTQTLLAGGSGGGVSLNDGGLVIGFRVGKKK